MKLHPDHKRNLDALRRIEGQVRGIQKMIEDRRYCVDILTQLRAVGQAVSRVEGEILGRHLDMCVKSTFAGQSRDEKTKKINEVIGLLKTFRSNH